MEKSIQRSALFRIKKRALLLVAALFVLAATVIAGWVAQKSIGGSLSQSFANPAADVRPKMRWWLPTAPMTDDEIRKEVHTMADAGIGGIEVVAFPVAGADHATYGWGSDEWNKRMRTALKAAQEKGIKVDFTVGPQYPAAVPSISKDSPAAAQELLYGQAVVPGGSVYSDVVPAFIEVPLDGPFGAPPRQPGTASIRAVTAARIADGSSPSAKPVMLDQNTAVDITSTVRNGRITWKAPNGGDWIIFSFWQRSTGQAVGGTSPASYVVDHFGAKGTEALTNHWNSKLLTPAVRDLLRSAGGDIYEDSLQLQSALHWTHELKDYFKSTRGYDITPYLPVLYIDGLHAFTGSGVSPDSPPDFDFANHAGTRIRNDYYQVLTDLYQRNHLDGLNKWADKHGLKLRAQVAYGAAIDMSSAATHVDIPETEQFYFGDTVDGYRAMAGGVHMGGKQVFSTEVAPVITGILQDSYGTSWKDMLRITNQNYAGGVNQAVLHGFPYASAPGASWPGWYPFDTPFLPGFGEAWGPRQPTWHHMPDITGYLARNQLILRTGKPQVDIAIYRQSYWDRAGKIFNDNTLGQTGYSYDFVGPALFNLPSAKVRDGRLSPDGPAYRALVLNQQEALPLETAKKLLKYADQGLPIIIIGELPKRTPFFAQAASQDTALRQVLNQLVAKKSVKRIASEAELRAALAQVNVRAAARYSTPAPLLNIHRADTNTDYYYLFNDSDATVSQNITFEGKGKPYMLDAWTGKNMAITKYVQKKDGIEVRVSLQPRETAIIALTKLAGFGSNQPVVVTRPAQTLSSWRLSVEDWQPGATATETAKTIHELELTELVPWPQIPALKDISGVGRYTTAITWDTRRADGAYLNLGAFFDTARVSVNGHSLPPVNLTNPVVDLGGYLKQGENTITVEVATTLRNRLRTYRPGHTGTAPQPNGLSGPVQLVPYVRQ